MRTLLKPRVLLAVILLVVGVGIWQSWTPIRRGGAHRPAPKIPTDVDRHLTGDLNYRLSWTPLGSRGGPDYMRVDWHTSARTTPDNPYWHNFFADPGTEIDVTATSVPQGGRQPGWPECWLFDRHGTLVDHDGPTDSPTGCVVRGIVK